MPDRLQLDIAGETVWLLADRALFWPRHDLLLIADLHLGKGDTFRSAGIAVPKGGTGFDLARLSRLLTGTAARRLIVLGDLIHGRADEMHWRSTWDAWRARHADIQIGAVVGNHDRALAHIGLPIEIWEAGVDLAPFALRHLPQAQPPLHVVCGHVHPVTRVAGMAGRWPAVVLDPDRTILPAFSAFTGGHEVRSDASRRLAVCNGDAIVLLAGTRRNRSVRSQA
jgi:DNA ligase-associated metallophosphoesterase